MGIACMKHDLVDVTVCGACYSELEAKLVEAEKFEAMYSKNSDYFERRLQVALERLGMVTRQLNCPYSHTSFGEDFHCNKCGFTKIINSGDER